MIRLSANLGFLWTELDLPEAIHAAASAGFHGVECHFPYATDSAVVKAAMTDANMPMIGLNTQRGNVSAGDNGLAAVRSRESEARDYIDEAIAYAAAVECSNVHVMAGFTDQGAAAENTFCENLDYACQLAARHDIQILIEPLNHYDAPGYHLNNLDAAVNTIKTVGKDNLKVMFDCYHIQIMQGDLGRRLESNLASVGHIQFAAVPDRGEPDLGEIHYPNLLATIDALGWGGFLGAEYKPRTGNTDDGLAWIKAYQ